MDNLVSLTIELGLKIIAAILVVAIYKFTHALVSTALGDKLPKFQGRLTLNPRANVDIVGILFFIYCGFGWGNTVETSPRNYKDKDRGTMIVGLSGPVICVMLAIISSIAVSALNTQLLVNDTLIPQNVLIYLLAFCRFIYVYSFNFAIISLLPMYPFDGYMIWGKTISAKNQYRIFQQETFNFTVFILIILLIPGAIEWPVNLLRELAIGKPIEFIVGQFF